MVKKEQTNGVIKDDSLSMGKIVSTDIVEGYHNKIRDLHKEISNVDTPNYFVEQKAGMDYVEEHYMRGLLNKYFPIWSWEIKKHEFLGDAWVVVHGRLTIMDNGVSRFFDAIASHRIQKKKGSDEYVDIGNDVKAANTDTFKVAVNRLCNVADDVYRKRFQDIDLSKEQLDNLGKNVHKIENKATKSKIITGIENQDINAINYDATMKKITRILGEQ